MKSHSVKKQTMPTYLGIYNALYSDILNGVYSPGQLLPGEIALSEKYGVSRNTLRQALAILSEDGMIIKSQGKGTMVSSHPERSADHQIENPLLAFCNQEITESRIHYNYGRPTEIARNKLQLTPEDHVLACNCVYLASDQVTGYSFTQIPSSYFELLDLNIRNEESIKECVQNTLFQQTKTMDVRMKLILANEIEVEFLEVPSGTPLLLLEALHRDKQDNLIARNKFYILSENYNLQYTLTSKTF